MSNISSSRTRSAIETISILQVEGREDIFGILENQRPTWMSQLHGRLDRAVWSAYGWDDPDPSEVEEDAIPGRLLALNLERAGAEV